MANIFKWVLMRFYSSRSEHSGAYQETMSFQGRRRFESILIMRGKDHFSLFSGCVIWKEQKTLTFATSTISIIVFFIWWEVLSSFAKRITSGYASKPAVCVFWARGALAGSCVYESSDCWALPWPPDSRDTSRISNPNPRYHGSAGKETNGNK